MNDYFSIIVDLLEMFIVAFYYMNMLKPKYKTWLVFSIWMLVMIVYELTTFPFRGEPFVRSPIFFALTVILLIFCFAGKWYQKAYALACHIGLVFVCEMIAMVIYRMLYGSDDMVIYSIERIIASIFYTIIFSIFAAVVVILNKRLHGTPLVITLAVQLTISLSQLLLVLLCFFQNPTAITEYELTFLIGASIPIIAINMLVYNVIDGISDIAVREKELEYQIKRDANEYAYYKMAIENERKISVMRHDIANLLQVAMTLAKNGSEDGSKLLGEFYKSYPRPIKYCDNEIINTILALRSAEMSERGIKCDIEIISDISETPLNESELSSVLSNLIDNAMRGSDGYEGEKYLHIKIGNKRDHFLIVIENPTGMYFDPDNPLTTKADKKNHGLGLKIIKNIVKKYSGVFNVEKNGDKVTAIVMIEYG